MRLVVALHENSGVEGVAPGEIARLTGRHSVHSAWAFVGFGDPNEMRVGSRGGDGVVPHARLGVVVAVSLE